MLVLAQVAWGVSPADKCEAAKNKIAGQYDACRLKTEATAVKTGGTPDFSKCDEKYAAKWTAAETDGGGMCPTNGDQSAMQGFITAHANTVAAALSGAGLPTCGDNVINVAGEQCDGADLGGETCATLGFSGGTLACSGCSFDTSGCTCGGGGAVLKTGQTTAYGAGSDGDLQKGASQSFTDNGDGTITDYTTGLMWEKKDQSGGIHDWNNTYTWSGPSYGSTNIMDGTIVTTFLATLNGGGGFAGHTDWRIPNLNELQSIRNLENVNPAVSSAFNTGCASRAAP